MAVVNRYTGAAELTDEQKSKLLHHRASGKGKSAGAYDPDHLVGPVRKARKIWDEFVAAQPEDPNEEGVAPDAYCYGRVSEQTKGLEGSLRHHVLVHECTPDQPGVRSRFRHKARNAPTRLVLDGTAWVPLCGFLPAKTKRAPLIVTDGLPTHLRCKECQGKAAIYVRGFSSD